MYQVLKYITFKMLGFKSTQTYFKNNKIELNSNQPLGKGFYGKM